MSPKFKKGEPILIAHTNEPGLVVEEPTLRRGEYWYTIQFVSRKEQVVEQFLSHSASPDADLPTLAQQGKWGRLQAVRCALGLERLRNTNRSTIYSYQAQRILFQPHQYKPLLKILDSLDRRILIADEVGLGKTIEAGIILAELQARGPLDRVLVVCPSRLREKWSNELNRKFNQDFHILDGRGFREAATRCAENSSRSQLHAIVSTQTMRSPSSREVLTNVLGQLDVVIMDEAHHARNPETSTSQLLSNICELSSTVVLLSATPLQIKIEDLFTLVSALRPAEFRNSHLFANEMDHFSSVHKASALARRQEVRLLPEIKELIASPFSRIEDPLAHRVVSLCEANTNWERRDWIELERQIQDLHPLGTIVTRTKKKDVDENAPTRRAITVRCDFSAQEDEAYQRLVQGTGKRGWSTRKLSLGEIQRARQAASCLPAALEGAAYAENDDDATEMSDIAPSEAKELGSMSLASNPFPIGTTGWSYRDSKLVAFLEMLDKTWSEEPEAKILVFAFFKGTVRYLEDQLLKRGINVTRIDGDVPSDPKNEAKDVRGQRIRDFELRSELKVLLSTEVGSEGLDFQFCHVLVNYDLPWNPMVVEQRIGRIDRFGQNSMVLKILNLVVSGTVEDLILERLYRRIGLFDRSIGASEAILGETMSKLKADFVSGKLTAEEAEARVTQAKNAILVQEQAQEQLEKDASELFGHEDYVREEMNRVRKLGRYISEQSIFAILETYFNQFHPEVRLDRSISHTAAIRVTDKLRQDLHRANIGNSIWIDRSDSKGILRLTTSGDAAFKDKGLELLNASHPLVRAATRAIQKQMDSPTARIGMGKVQLDLVEDSNISSGVYIIALFAHQVTGIRSRRILEPIAWQAETGRLIPTSDAERLLFLAVEIGEELDDLDDASELKDTVWEEIQDEAHAENMRLSSNESLENEARYVRRKRAIKLDFEHSMKAKTQRLASAKRAIDEAENSEEANRRARIIPALEGQIHKANADYARRLEELEGSKQVSASLSEPLAICKILAEK